MIKNLWKKHASTIISVACILVIAASFILHFHNVPLYNPKHGFDGKDHLIYINYIYQHKSIPQPGVGNETHQSPLYYLLGAGLVSLTGQWKTAQYLNVFVLWMIIGVIGLGLWRLFQKREPVLMGMFSLAALPMLNIFPAMLTNEFLSTFWIISAVIACIYLVGSKTKEEFAKYSIWFALSVVLGFWTKVSMVLIIPTAITAYGLCFFNKKIDKKAYFSVTTLVIVAVVLLSATVLLRSRSVSSPSNIQKIVTAKIAPQPPSFYYRFDWIPKVDMYNTQYYSLWGGAWNSFFNDGHNVLTPFIKFHKKAFILWTLGFLLLPISLYGLLKLPKDKKKEAIVVYMVGLSMLGFYIVYNIYASHYSAARLTYEMAVVVPYAAGIAGAAAKNTKLKLFLLALLTLQFIVLVSFFWIQPWWFVTK